MTTDAVSTIILTPSSSSPFSVVVVGALVGVVAALFVIILMGVVIVVCFRRRRRKKTSNMEAKLWMSKNEADGMEFNTRGPGSITYNNCNYEQTHINTDSTKQPPPPAVSTDEDTVSPVLPADGDVSTDEDIVSSVLPVDGAMRESNQLTGIQHTVDHSIVKEEPRGPAVITHNNCNYQQTHLNKQLPPARKDSDICGVSTFLPVDAAMEKVSQGDSVDQAIVDTVVTEIDAARSGDLESNQLIESQYPTVGHRPTEKKHAELLVSSTTPHEVAKKNVPIVSKKPLKLSKDVRGGGEKEMRNGEKHTPKYIMGNSGKKRREQEDPVSKLDTFIVAPIEATPIEATSTGVTPIGATSIGDTTIEGILEGEHSKTEDPHCNLDGIYNNPDALTCGNEGEGIYDTVYSESLQPSMFSKSPEQALEKKEEVKKDLADRKIEDADKEEGEEEVEDVYAPIYSLPTALESSGTVLQFKPENIHRIKTLGTGHFGKVLLADTVGLSLKELKISETDDDKSKSVRVAVKTLRRKPKRQKQQAFNKELKFMSRLNHPNVIRTLGACMVDTPFIVMEYMEKGDLNGYLQDFDTIEQGNAPPTDLTISVGTLVSMSSQIADAMKYLASRNYIHRDLATRNCLVGPESRIKIADFGMSKSLYESHYYTIEGHIVLPVRWMAKECFYGKFSAKTDVWAFGVTMWEIFTLAKDIPYEDMDDSEVAADASRREGDRQLLQRSCDCPPEVYDIMLMCWKWEPSDRATFETLHKALFSLDM